MREKLTNGNSKNGIRQRVRGCRHAKTSEHLRKLGGHLKMKSRRHSYSFTSHPAGIVTSLRQRITSKWNYPTNLSQRSIHCPSPPPSTRWVTGGLFSNDWCLYGAPVQACLICIQFKTLFQPPITTKWNWGLFNRKHRYIHSVKITALSLSLTEPIMLQDTHTLLGSARYHL